MEWGQRKRKKDYPFGKTGVPYKAKGEGGMGHVGPGYFWEAALIQINVEVHYKILPLGGYNKDKIH